MSILLKNGKVFTRSGFHKKDILIKDKKIFTQFDISTFDRVIDCSNLFIVPGFVDVHVHLREPGFFYKETIKSGTTAAAASGYTTVCAMPNLNPAPTTLENLKVELSLIKKDAMVKVIPYGTITKTIDGKISLADISDMAPFVVGYSDDGRGVQLGELMEDAMKEVKKVGKIIAAHCEDESIKGDGYINEGVYQLIHNHKGIPKKSEWIQVKRDIELCEKTGCMYHICHVSTKESVALIREAKKKGINVSAETAPHYLTLCDSDLKEDGNFKMNPPLRDRSDMEALIEGVMDKTIDIIATDHAPHSKEEKNKGLIDSAFGVVGLETAFPMLYTKLVLTKKITLERLLQMMCILPRDRFNLEGPRYIEDNEIADIAILDLDSWYTISSDNFYSMGKNTPFEGEKVKGKAKGTIVDGKMVYSYGL